MKRIYLLSLALIAFIGNSFAQISTDLQLLQVINQGNAITIKATNAPKATFLYVFINKGAAAITVADTIKLKTPYQSYTLTLPSAGIPVGDTVYFRDTIGFVSGPASTTSYSWCDSASVKGGPGRTFTDPNPANNKVCSTVQIINQSTGISNLFSIQGRAAQTLTLYPNPATDAVNFNFDFGFKAVDAHLFVRDITGRIVYHEDYSKSQSGEKTFTVPTDNFRNGMYLVEFLAGDERSVGKFTVQK